MLSDSFRLSLQELCNKENFVFKEYVLTNVVFNFLLSDSDIEIKVYIEEMEEYIEIEIIHKSFDGVFIYTSRQKPKLEGPYINIFDYSSEHISKSMFDSKVNNSMKKYRSLFQQNRKLYSDQIANLYCELICYTVDKIRQYPLKTATTK